jgi:hypothetical protein
MSPVARTISEQLFESFCTENGFQACPVRTESHRTPDYILRIGGISIVVEVKQFDPNAAELATLRKLPEEWGESDTFSAEIPGERVRSKIDSALPQLKKVAGTSIPAMLVLYDNVRLWPEICDANSIGVALYGIESALISSKQAPEGGATIVARWHGGSRRATPSANTTLSAIGILDRRRESNEITLSLFHNYFARNPIAIDALRCAQIKHYKLLRSPEQFFSTWTAT